MNKLLFAWAMVSGLALTTAALAQTVNLPSAPAATPAPPAATPAPPASATPIVPAATPIPTPVAAPSVVAAPVAVTATLKDNTQIEFGADGVVMIVNPDGSKVSAPDGVLTLKDGTTFTVKEGKRVAAE